MKKTPNIQLWDKVLSTLNQKLAQPTPELPSVQIFTSNDLRKLLAESLIETDTRHKPFSGAQLLLQLQQSGLSHLIKLDTTTSPTIHLWQVGFGAKQELNPLEILQSVKPQGVICYFSALSFHSLTTQMPPHHHIASLDHKPRAKTVFINGHTEKIPALGSLLFQHDGLPYYHTSRLASLVPGVKSYYLSDKAIIRITDLEQTLLDTLHRPWHCGGAAVVMEAWENGLTKLNESWLAHHLQSIQHSLLTRRTGCILMRCGYSIKDSALTNILAAAKASAANEPIAHLLPAIPGTCIDTDWNLEVLG